MITFVLCMLALYIVAGIIISRVYWVRFAKTEYKLMKYAWISIIGDVTWAVAAIAIVLTAFAR